MDIWLKSQFILSKSSVRLRYQMSFYPFHYMKETFSPNPYLSLSLRPRVTWKDSKSQTFISSPFFFFITLGFLAHTESVYSTKASVFINEALLPPFSPCGYSLATSGLITMGKWLETSLIYPVLRAPCTPLWFWPDTLHKSISCY